MENKDVKFMLEQTHSETIKVDLAEGVSVEFNVDRLKQTLPEIIEQNPQAVRSLLDETIEQIRANLNAFQADDAKPDTTQQTQIYGRGGTIHKSTDINVELDESGKVIAVWFRCLHLPFTQSISDNDRKIEMLSMYEDSENQIEIQSIEFLRTKKSEKSDEKPQKQKL